MMLVRAMISGWELDIVEPCSNPLKGDKKYDVTALVPMQVHHSFKDLSKAKLILVGGGKVSKPLQEKLQKVPTRVFSTYGMTETITHIAVKKINHLNGITNYFEVFPDISIEKDDRDCLVINAPNISDKKVITNDIVKVIDSKHFCWIGRYDNIINSGGVKISPESIEEKLSDVIKQRFFIASEKDEVLGEKVILIIERKKNSKFKIQDSIFSFLGKYEKPKKVYYVDKFMETKTNKVNRKLTLELV
jgi:O-succinylbenzoic acid--CoA ligase